MKTTEENLDDSGFEEVQSEEKNAEAAKTGNRPDISLVQTEVDRD